MNTPTRKKPIRKRWTLAEMANFSAVHDRVCAKYETEVAHLRAELKKAKNLEWSAFAAGAFICAIVVSLAHAWKIW